MSDQNPRFGRGELFDRVWPSRAIVVWLTEVSMFDDPLEKPTDEAKLSSFVGTELRLSTVSESSQSGRGVRIASKVGEGGVRRDGKDEDVGPGRHGRSSCGVGVAQNGGCLIQAAIPAGLAGIAKDQGVAGKAGCDQDGARGGNKLRPMRSDPEQVTLWNRQPRIEPAMRRADLERDEFDTVGQDCTYALSLARPAKRDGAS